MNDPMLPVLRGLERELSIPPRQDPRGYASPQHREPQGEIDPVVKGLLTHLPVAGSVWPSAERTLWLELLEGTFRMIYVETEKGAGPQPDAPTTSTTP